MERRRARSVATSPYSSFGFSPIAPFDRSRSERTSRRNVEVEEVLKWAVQRANSIWRCCHLRSWARNDTLMCSELLVMFREAAICVREGGIAVHTSFICALIQMMARLAQWGQTKSNEDPINLSECTHHSLLHLLSILSRLSRST